MAPLKIAMLTHSVNPRGGVVHALQLAESLQALGQQVTLFAPDAAGRGLFREPACAFHGIPGQLAVRDVADMVRLRIDDYLRCFDSGALAGFDLWHAQDSISANALASLVERGAIAGYVRTVHHLDHFDDQRLHDWQRRGYRSASSLLCVSRLWQDILRDEHGLQAELVSNGVDTMRYQARRNTRDMALRRELGLTGTPVLLAVGGVEPRKNTLGILRAFIKLRQRWPQAQLLIAGGASVLDHAAYGQQFQQELAASGLPEQAVKVLGRVDDADMPALFRSANALVFPSLTEGFGLVVLEAMASGVPVVVSRIAPFVDHLDPHSCAWVDPNDPASIAAGIIHACDPSRRTALVAAGHAVCARFSWPATAQRHLELYRLHLRRHLLPSATTTTTAPIEEENHA